MDPEPARYGVDKDSGLKNKNGILEVSRALDRTRNDQGTSRSLFLLIVTKKSGNQTWGKQTIPKIPETKKKTEGDFLKITSGRHPTQTLGLNLLRHVEGHPYGDEPFVALLETSTFGSPGGGKESVYRSYLVTTVWYFAIIEATPFLRPVNSRGTITIFFDVCFFHVFCFCF